jgi:hypothetical protein
LWGHHLEQLVVILFVATGIFVKSSLTSDRVLASRWLAMDFSLWLHYSGFQAVLTEPLPSKWTSASVRCYFGFQAVFTEPLPSYGHICHNIIASTMNKQNRGKPPSQLLHHSKLSINKRG